MYDSLLYIVRWLWYPRMSALVLSMIRMWYIYIYYLLYITINGCIFRVWQWWPSGWHRYFYLGGMWTGDWNRPSGWEVKFSWKNKTSIWKKIWKNLKKRRWHWSCMLPMSSMITRYRWMQCSWRLERLETMPLIKRLGIIMLLEQLLPFLRFWLHLLLNLNALGR